MPFVTLDEHKGSHERPCPPGRFGAESELQRGFGRMPTAHRAEVLITLRAGKTGNRWPAEARIVNDKGRYHEQFFVRRELDSAFAEKRSSTLKSANSLSGPEQMD